VFTNSWYALVSKLDRNAEVTLMNYGYAHADGTRIWLEPEHETERYALQLYHHVATGVSLEGKDVLEVGSGRGGGAAYISRYLKPRQMVGVDRTASSVGFARRHFAAQKNLRFKEADAHDLPFEDASFDAVVNIVRAALQGDRALPCRSAPRAEAGRTSSDRLLRGREQGRVSAPGASPLEVA
jgi:SAM-dependent methyltransferase